jgi:hypothetical protein
MLHKVFDNVVVDSSAAGEYLEVVSRAFDLGYGNAVGIQAELISSTAQVTTLFLETSNDLQNWGDRVTVLEIAEDSLSAFGKLSGIAALYGRVVVAIDAGAIVTLAAMVETMRK